MLMKYLYLILLLSLGGMAARSQTCLDSSFADNGILDWQPENEGFVPLPLADGKTLFAALQGFERRFFMKRFNADGSQDMTFGNAGSVYYGTTNFIVRAMQQDASDGIYIIFNAPDNTNKVYKPLLKIKPDGSIDRNYGSNGYAVSRQLTDSAGVMVWRDTPFDAEAMCIQKDGKVVLAHNRASIYDYVCLIRFNTDGSLDTTFGDKGWVQTYNGIYNGRIANMELMTDGRIVIGGDGYDDNHKASLMLMRFMPDGSLDSSFNGNGKLYSTFGTNNMFTFGRGMCLQPDGKILLTGSLGPPFVARFNIDGSLDAGFGSGGIFMPDEGRELYPAGIALHGGRIYVITRVGAIGYTHIGLFRLHSNGNMDRTFCNNGWFEYKPPQLKSGTPFGKLWIDGNSLYIGGWNVIETPIEIDRYVYMRLPLSPASASSCPPVLYPNPVRDMLQLDIAADMPFSIYDAAGKLCLQGSAVPGRGIAITGLAAGMYVLRLETASSCSYKFQKL